MEGNLYDEFESIFIDNDKPEIVDGISIDCPNPPVPPPPNPKEYFRHHNKNIINRPYSDDPIPGPIKPDFMIEDIGACAPNPVPNTYIAPGRRRPCPPPPPPPCKPPCPPPPHDRCVHPMEWEEDHRYVTKHELNRILTHIADADIFRDLSVNGTTVSVGGIKKGTKFRKLTFSQLMCLLLYPKNGADDQEYVCETPDGKTILNSTVKYPLGGFSEGDSLKGMTISQIIETLLCGKNNWGVYKWKSDAVVVTSGTTTIEAEDTFPYLVSDYKDTNKYELHIVSTATDISDESKWDFNNLIAQKDNVKQQTSVTIEGVPTDLKWSYNPETKKITLHSETEITADIAVVMIRK